MQVSPRYYPSFGGVEGQVKQISERLVRLGHQVEACTTDPTWRLPKFDNICGVSVRRFNSFAPHEAYYLVGPDFELYMKHNDADVVHVHSLHCISTVQAIRALPHMHNIVLTPHYHGPAHTLFRAMLYRSYSAIAKRLMRKVTRFICVSKTEMLRFVTDFEVDPAKVSVIPNGLDLKELASIRRKTDPDVLRLLYVGRLHGYKNPDKFLHTVKLLKQRIRDRIVLAHMVGRGPMMTQLAKQVRNLGLQESVEIVSDLPRAALLELYAKTDVFVLPSLHEAFGVAAAEALAVGIPTVVAKSAALKEFVDEGVAEGVDPPITAEKLCEAVLKAKTPNRGLRFLDWDQVITQQAEIYSSILSEKTKVAGSVWSIIWRRYRQMRTRAPNENPRNRILNLTYSK